MRENERLSFRWLAILVGLVAATGFCLTPALAEDMDIGPETDEAIVEPDDGIVFEEYSDDEEIQDGSFGEYTQVTWVGAASFVPRNHTTQYQRVDYGYIYFTGGTPHCEAQFNLPSGAFLQGMRSYYYDNSAANVTVHLWHERPTGYTHLKTITSSGTPGYSNTFGWIDHTITNNDGWYHLRAETGASNNTVMFHGVKLYWKRQIRTGLPHPFTDIGHLPQLWRDSIAALKASGITSGTTATTYSPDDNLTRGQMAVFLAKALGLYWSVNAGY